jgi:hypothetical protein
MKQVPSPLVYNSMWLLERVQKEAFCPISGTFTVLDDSRKFINSDHTPSPLVVNPTRCDLIQSFIAQK